MGVDRYALKLRSYSNFVECKYHKSEGAVLFEVNTVIFCNVFLTPKSNSNMLWSALKRVSHAWMVGLLLERTVDGRVRA